MVRIKTSTLPKQPLADGGEGFIYDLNNGTLLKMFKPHVNMNEKLKKINLMLSKKLPPNVISPIDIAENERGQFIGYVMKKVEGDDFKKLSNKKFIKANKITIKDVTNMLIEIKKTLQFLHQSSIFIGDLNDGNILFDSQKRIYFIDCDSWTIEQYRCDVCMETFKDPLLKGNDFSSHTDAFAFAILAFKSLTRLHPFGGTTTPDMDIIERMVKRISVIERSNITIPKTVSDWSFFSPTLKDWFLSIFEKGYRALDDEPLNDFLQHLKFCSKHGNDYYGKFSECPVCFAHAKILTAPVKIESNNSIPIIRLFKDDAINMLLSYQIVLNNDNKIVHRKSGKSVSFQRNEKVYFSDDGTILYRVFPNKLVIESKNGTSQFEKPYQSFVEVRDNKAYYINMNLNLTELTITDKGNFSQTLGKVSFNHSFQAIDSKHFCILNHYDNSLVLNVDGYHLNINKSVKIVNSSLHYDNVNENWLIIFEDSKGIFTTIVLNKNKILFESAILKYYGNIDNIAFNNNVIFRANDGFIRGFQFEKNLYKDFSCSIVNDDSKLIRSGKSFIVINEKEIYQVG